MFILVFGIWVCILILALAIMLFYTSMHKINAKDIKKNHSCMSEGLQTSVSEQYLIEVGSDHDIW